MGKFVPSILMGVPPLVPPVVTVVEPVGDFKAEMVGVTVMAASAVVRYPYPLIFTIGFHAPPSNNLPVAVGVVTDAILHLILVLDTSAAKAGTQSAFPNLIDTSLGVILLVIPVRVKVSSLVAGLKEEAEKVLSLAVAAT
jgi:hypothetical protein